MVKMTSEQEDSPRHSPHEDNSYDEEADESSDFVVLNHSAFTTPDISYNHLGDLQFSIASNQSDLSPEDVQQWINQLLKENQELRDSLSKTNITMKQQFQTLQTWESQFMANCNQYKLQIAATQECKVKLEEENKNLRKTVEELEAFRNAKNEEVEEKGQELEKQKKLTLELENEVSYLQTQIVELNKEIQNLNEIKESTVNSISKDQSSLKVEQSIQTPSIIVSTEDYCFIDPAKEFPTETCSGGSERSSSAEVTMIEASKLVSASIQMHEEQTKVSQLSQQVAELQFEISKLQLSLSEKEKENEKLRACLEDSSKFSPLEKQQQAVANQLRASEEKFHVAAISAQKYKEKCESLQHYLNIYQQKLESLRLNDTAVIENLQLEITTLRHMLAEEQVAKLEDKKHLEDVRQQFDNMMMDFKKDELEAWKQLESRRHQEDLDKATAVLVEKNDEIHKLQEEIQQLRIKVEKIAILEAQVQLYSQDFEDESNARRKAEKDISNLRAELQSLFTEKEKLAEQVSSLSQSPGHHRRHRRTNYPQQEHQNPGHDKLDCPKCGLVFTDLRALINHTETCITNNPYDFP